MADPQRDLAPIIEPPPAAVATPHAAGPGPALWLGLVFIGLALAAAVAWYWRRSAPLRQVRRLARSATPRTGADALAGLLARLADPHLDPAWLGELERLRFGRPGPDDAAILARLCRDAERALVRRR